MKFETVFEYIPKFETKSNGKVKERTSDPFCAIGKLQVLGGRKRRRKIGDLEQRLIGIYDWWWKEG